MSVDIKDEPRAGSPILSLLIPAYNYVPGVMQIVTPLLEERRRDIEILVHDDSNNDSVERAITPLLQSHRELRYLRNRPSRGAVANWNNLFNSARGRYVLLVHHDDFPLSKCFASEVIADLERSAWPDILLLDCVTHDVVRNRLRIGVCNWVTRFVAKRFPVYLLRRNVIGPPSVFILRRDLFEPYDVNLKWLVDVEAYFRFLSKGKPRVESSRLVMVSSTGLPGAITTSIGAEKHRITNTELEYISKKFGVHWFLNLLTARTFIAKAARALEWLFWLALKLSSSPFFVFAKPRLLLKNVQLRRTPS